MLDNKYLCELPIVFQSELGNNLENLGIDTKNVDDETTPGVIDLAEVAEFNPSTEENQICLRLYCGISFIIDIPYEQFKKFYEETIGKPILIYASIRSDK
jgi:hypothetical protein